MPPAFPLRLVNLLAKLLDRWHRTLDGAPACRLRNDSLLQWAVLWLSLRQRTIYEDTIDNLLDRLGNMREEMVAIERSLERINAAKLEPGKDKPGKQ